jgi:hypothetical protein
MAPREEAGHSAGQVALERSWQNGRDRYLPGGTTQMSKRDEQKRGGATKQSKTHAEGQHGDKTHARLIEQLHSGPTRDSEEDQRAARHEQSGHEGKRRLVEDREQHDEADRNSDKARLARDIERGTEPGPSDNTSSLHGVFEHREHRSDYQQRDESGFRAKP